MPDALLRRLRRAISALTDDGRFCVVCARTGERPVPVARCRFATRRDAETAARLAERYRTVLRARDSQVPPHDPIACECPALGDATTGAGDREATQARPIDDGTTDPDVGESCGDEADPRTGRDWHDDGRVTGPPSRLRFCHDVAGAVFETLRETGLDGLEARVMDAYVAAADEVADPDELCVHLVDRMAATLRTGLSRPERVHVCRDAAARLTPPAVSTGFPLVAAFERLGSVDLLDSFTVSPWEVDERTTRRSCVAAVEGYAIAPRDGTVTTLPLALDVLRRDPQARPILAPVARLPHGRLEFRVASSDDGEPAGIAQVPLRE